MREVVGLEDVGHQHPMNEVVSQCERQRPLEDGLLLSVALPALVVQLVVEDGSVKYITSLKHQNYE